MSERVARWLSIGVDRRGAIVRVDAPQGGAWPSCDVTKPDAPNPQIVEALEILEAGIWALPEQMRRALYDRLLQTWYERERPEPPLPDPRDDAARALWERIRDSEGWTLLLRRKQPGFGVTVDGLGRAVDRRPWDDLTDAEQDWLRGLVDVARGAIPSVAFVEEPESIRGWYCGAITGGPGAHSQEEAIGRWLLARKEGGA